MCLINPEGLKVSDLSQITLFRLAFLGWQCGKVRAADSFMNSLISRFHLNIVITILRISPTLPRSAGHNSWC